MLFLKHARKESEVVILLKSVTKIVKNKIHCIAGRDASQI